RRHRQAHPAAERVAERLQSCDSRARCLSGACPECCRAHQRWFVDNSRRLIRNALRAVPLLMVTIAPGFGQCPIDRLETLNVEAVWRKTARILRRLGIQVALGGT